MALFLRQQLSPYRLEVEVRRTSPRGLVWTDQQIVPALHLEGPTPHGRNSHEGKPAGADWGPDKFGYTDFDDYHLAIFGA